jgi:hypothetical protein
MVKEDCCKLLGTAQLFVVPCCDGFEDKRGTDRAEVGTFTPALWFEDPIASKHALAGSAFGGGGCWSGIT